MWHCAEHKIGLLDIENYLDIFEMWTWKIRAMSKMERCGKKRMMLEKIGESN